MRSAPRAVDARGSKRWVGVEIPLAASKCDGSSRALRGARIFARSSVWRFLNERKLNEKRGRCRSHASGFSVEQLIAHTVAFFVLRDNDTPVGCRGIQLFGIAYGELNRLYVPPIPWSRLRHEAAQSFSRLCPITRG
jgi:hypothetical protein